MNTLSSLSTLPDQLGIDDQLSPLVDAVFGDLTDRLEVTSFYEEEIDGVSQYTMVLSVQETMLLPVPGFDAIALGVVRDDPDEAPLILAEIIVDGAPPRLTLRHFPLRVMIEQPLLLPLPPEEDGSPALEGFSFELEGSFSVDTTLEVSATLESFTLPPFTVSGTGLAFALDTCRLITSAEEVDDAIIDLGFDDGFRGIHAESAQVHWDIP
ncbi:MAG: hypothetical protein AAF184_22945, partial [Pseudomonadota bacterium]